MPEIVHETLRSQTVIIGSYEVSYDDKGIATVPVDLYELVCKGEIKKVTPLKAEDAPKEEVAEDEVKEAPEEETKQPEIHKKKLVFKKKK